jgi:hypothetical protein
MIVIDKQLIGIFLALSVKLLDELLIPCQEPLVSLSLLAKFIHKVLGLVYRSLQEIVLRF